MLDQSVKLRWFRIHEHPELMHRAARWFSDKWKIPQEEYRRSMEESRGRENGIPRWYLVMDDADRIVAGAGIIANDFHDRPDLTPNLCALFVEEEFRGRGIARGLLDLGRADAGKMGYQKLYLVTDHTAFYERCGWNFLTMVTDDEGVSERMYEADCGMRPQIYPDFRAISFSMPFSREILRMAKVPVILMQAATAAPYQVKRRRVQIRGYQGEKIGVEIFEPRKSRGKCLPALLYLHGGGFGYGAAPYHKKLAGIYAAAAGCRVIFPDYHLLPDHPYPAAKYEALRTYAWICENSRALRIDPRRIAVGGDSAGAVLAAYVCGQRVENYPRPCFQMLIYPVTDAAMETRSMLQFENTPLWNSRNNRKMWEWYLSGVGAGEVSKASPMQRSLHRPVPDTYVEVAEADCLHDEGVRYAERLRRAGASVELCETRGTIHGYDMAMSSVITGESIRKRVRALRRGFGRKVDGS